MGLPSSFSNLSAIPSSIQALPNTVPERIHSTVFVPIAFVGAESSMAGNWDVPLESAFKDISTPGAMVHPKNTPPSSITEILVAVPKSVTRQGRGY